MSSFEQSRSSYLCKSIVACDSQSDPATADAAGTGALLVCLAMGAMYQQAPMRQKSAASRVSNRAEKDALLPK